MRVLGVGDLAQPVSTRASLTDAMKVEVANASDVLVDLTEFLVSIEYESGADEIVDAATLVFRRLSGAESLAPLMTADPPVQLGRRFVIWVNPGGGFEEVLRGKITDVDWPLRYGDVTVQCLDQAGEASRTWIEEPIEYGSTTGVPLEDVMQAVSDDNMVVSPTLYFPVPTDAVVQHIEGDAPYGPTEQSVLEAERALAESFGGTIRWRYSDSLGGWRWTVFTPSRTKTVPDYTFTPSDYFDVKQIKLSDVDIRNVIEVEYIREGVRESVEVEDAASIALYGRLYAKISEGSDSPVNNATLATALGNAALSDLKDPDVLLEIACRYFWPGEIGVDLYRFTANGVHFSANQDLAPMQFRHRIAINEAPTSHVMVRGKPSGGVLSWRRRGLRSADGLKPLFDIPAFRVTNFREIERTATTLTVGWNVAGSTLKELWLYLLTKAQPVTSDPWALLGGAPTVRLTPDTTSYTVAIPQTGYVTYGRLVPIAADGSVGSAWDFTVQPNDQVPLIENPWQTIAAGGLTTDLTFTVSDPAGLGGTLSVWTNHDSADDADSTGAVEGTFAIASTPATVNQATTFTLTAGGTSTLLNDIKVHAGKGKRVFAKFVNSQGVESEVTAILLKPGKPPVDSEGVLTPGIITDVTPFASGMSPVRIVTSLPADGTLSTVVFLTTDKRLYRWTGTVWESVVAEFAGTIGTAQIADLAVTTAKFASGIRPVRIVVALPGSGDTEGDTVYLTTDDKLYRWTGSAWTVAVDGADIVAASIIAGKLAVGAINAGSLFVAGVVGGTAIADGAIVTQHMTANTINGNRILVASLDGDRITANSILAGQIAAGAINTDELAAGAATAEKMSVGELSAISANLGTITSGHLRNSGDTAAIRLSGATALPSTNFIDFTSTGANPFLKHPGATLLADGTATFKAVKITGDGPSPTVATGLTTQLGTGYTLSISGKDTGGTVSLSTGTVPTGIVGRPQTICTVTFGTAYTTAPHVLLIPIHLDSSDSAFKPWYADDVTTTTFAIKSAVAGVSGYEASKNYKWSYVVIG